MNDFQKELDKLIEAEQAYDSAKKAFYDQLDVIRKLLKCPACGARMTESVRLGMVKFQCTHCGLNTGDVEWDKLPQRWSALVHAFEKDCQF